MEFKLKNLIVKYDPAISLSRNSMLLLIKMNAFRIANALHKAGAGESKSIGYKKLMEIWKKLGGNTDTFLHAIKQGMRVEYKHHKGSHPTSQAAFNFDGLSDSFFLPAMIAQAAAASPIIKKLLDFLKSMGIETKDIVAAAKGATKMGIDKLVKQNGRKVVTNRDGSKTLTIPSNTPIEGVSGGSNKIIIFAGAALALILAYKFIKK